MAETNYTPILPFDITYGETMLMYDNMTYVRDLSICTPDSIVKESGNILKYFRCTQKDAVQIGGETNTSPKMEAAINKYKKYCENKAKAEKEVHAQDNTDDEELFDADAGAEAAATLLKDNSFSL